MRGKLTTFAARNLRHRLKAAFVSLLRFNPLIYLTIGINTIALAMDYDGASEGYRKVRLGRRQDEAEEASIPHSREPFRWLSLNTKKK